MKSEHAAAEAVAVAPFSAIPKPELVFGLVGAVGTDLGLVAQVLEQELENVGYQSTVIRLTNHLLDLDHCKGLPTSPREVRYHAYMTAGNGFREDLGRGDALALLGIAAIKERRGQINRQNDNPELEAPVQDGRAYIIHQIKHPEEVHTLNKVYGALFI